MFFYHLLDDCDHSCVLVCSLVFITQTSDFGAEFDVVIANILAPTLVTLMPEIARLMRPGGGEFE